MIDFARLGVSQCDHFVTPMCVSINIVCSGIFDVVSISAFSLKPV